MSVLAKAAKAMAARRRTPEFTARDTKYESGCNDTPVMYAVDIDDSPYMDEYRATIYKKVRGSKYWEKIMESGGSWDGRISQANAKRIAKDWLGDAYQYDEDCG